MTLQLQHPIFCSNHGGRTTVFCSLAERAARLLVARLAARVGRGERGEHRAHGHLDLGRAQAVAQPPPRRRALQLLDAHEAAQIAVELHLVRGLGSGFRDGFGGQVQVWGCG